MIQFLYKYIIKDIYSLIARLLGPFWNASSPILSQINTKDEANNIANCKKKIKYVLIARLLGSYLERIRPNFDLNQYQSQAKYYCKLGIVINRD